MLRNLDAVMANGASPAMAHSLEILQGRAANAVLSKRHFVMVQQSKDGAHLTVDPRMLVFEFAQDILMRKSQVDLIDQFIKTAATGGSMVSQMIMGAGKTTVVGPLLALLLANGENLVVQVVPHALLEFSRGVLRSRFASVIRKPVYTFEFDRFKEVTPQIYSKMLRARDTRSVVISTPKAIKSFFLKYVELLYDLDTLSRGAPVITPAEELRKQAEECIKVVHLWRDSNLILDEVDLILHPLKSELNYPVGIKMPLDFTDNKIGRGMRWELPFFIVDGISFATGGTIRESYKHSRQMVDILKKMKAAIAEGHAEKAVQMVPHFVVLRKSFYFTKLQPLLADWLFVWIGTKGVKGVDERAVKEYMMKGSSGASKEAIGTLNSEQVKLLNVCHDWLHSLLPHVLTKINRVSFGTLSAEDLERQLAIDPRMPKSRRLLAIPYVGKDVPSPSSEFAHPDVAIGLTIMAYRYQGMRRADFKAVMLELKKRMQKEDGPYGLRHSSITFAKWVITAGAVVRGTKRELKARADALLEQGIDANFTDNNMAALEDRIEIWPLRLVDIHDKEQFDVLYDLLGRSAHVIHYYLCEVVFPDVMRHQSLKISASGQELGGEALFSRRFGFSGTPSDLLPLDLGECHYEEGSDGKMVYYLTSPDIVTRYEMQEGWSVRSLLREISHAPQGTYRALIDTGALVTGFTNIEVAEILMADGGLPGVDGVVYLDSLDRKMILLRKTMRSVLLEESGVPTSKRFAFYDEVHTTGMDIHHTSDALAALTLGKDMTFRDYAQV